MFRINDDIQFNGEVYELVEFLGNGGMGQVFLIEEQNTNSQFAMKTLTNFLPDDENYRSLINEWERAQEIDHENVIRYLGFDSGDAAKRSPFIVMDLAHDGTLQNFLDKQTEFLKEQACLQIFHQIIDGMEAINSVLIHRDIKPDNIFIDNGILKIADFGLAKLVQEKTRSRTFKGWGTAPYIAPEAFRSEKNTIQMDMYSIGHVFFQIGGLRHAFGNQTDWERAHLTMIPPALNNINSNISPKVASIVNKLIEKKPKDRYQNWGEVRKDLLASTNNIGSNKEYVNVLIQKKLDQDLEIKKSLTKNQLEAEKIQRQRDILNDQFEQTIQRPLVELVDQLNATLQPDEAVNLVQTASEGVFSLRLQYNRKEVSIWFKEITESDFRQYSQKNMWGESIKSTVRPSLRGRLIMAWGAVEASNGKGLNIILVESNDDAYGDWYILENSDNGLSFHQNRRETPFAFQKQELRKEIYNVGVMHIYNMRDRPLDTDSLIKFITAAF